MCGEQFLKYSYSLPKPKLTIILLVGNDIREDTVVTRLERSIVNLCKEVEAVHQRAVRFYLLEPRLITRDVELDSFERICNAMNKKVLQRNRFMSDKVIVTPLKYENLSVDGIHPNPQGKLMLIDHIKSVTAEFFYAQSQE